jgi:hypothetical protein
MKYASHLKYFDGKKNGIKIINKKTVNVWKMCENV